MINNPDWQKPKIKLYLHQLLMPCIQGILCNEIEDDELLGFAIDNMEELLSYIVKGNLNIRIQRDIAGEMWFGVG